MFPVYLKTKGSAEPQDPIYYLVTASGIFLVKQNQFFRSTVRVEGVSFLAKQKETLQLNLAKKIPYKLIKQAMEFFQAVYKKHRTEAIVLIYYFLEKNEYEVVVPEQFVSKFSCRYKVPNKTADKAILFATCHSHGSLEAYTSTEDEKDEKYSDGFHIIVGNLDFVPTIFCSAIANGRRFPIAPPELIEEFPEPEVPTSWLEKVIRRLPRNGKVPRGIVTDLISLFPGGPEFIEELVTSRTDENTGKDGAKAIDSENPEVVE